MSALSGKVIAVAGASGPAGQAVLRRLAADGATVIGADIDPRRLETALDAVRTAVPGAKISGQVIDLLDPQEVHDWADHLDAEHGQVDGLFHLVGGWRGSKTFFDTRIDDWDWLQDRVVRTLALADSFTKETTSADGLPTAAAAILVIKALVTPQMRADKPDAKFTGFTDTADLADTLAGLWDRPAADLNGQHLWLTAR
jgi:NAD(P)-dependent dehydrogenase (short-subunit alcohol dehydrogenase family)